MQEFMMGESISESVKNEDLTPGIYGESVKNEDLTPGIYAERATPCDHRIRCRGRC